MGSEMCIRDRNKPFNFVEIFSLRYFALLLTTSRPSSITRYPFASELSASVTLELSCIVKVSLPQRLFVIVAFDFFLTSIVTSCDILHPKYIVLPVADVLLPK